MSVEVHCHVQAGDRVTAGPASDGVQIFYVGADLKDGRDTAVTIYLGGIENARKVRDELTARIDAQEAFLAKEREAGHEG